MICSESELIWLRGDGRTDDIKSQWRLTNIFMTQSSTPPTTQPLVRMAQPTTNNKCQRKERIFIISFNRHWQAEEMMTSRAQKEIAFVIVSFILSILLLLQNGYYLNRFLTSVERAVEDLQHISQPQSSSNSMKSSKMRVKFIPYPHRTSLGSGASIQCHWETSPHSNNSYDDKLTKTMTGGDTPLDFTQKNALSEGICISEVLSKSIHIFSSSEAIECLSSAPQLILTGDSYTKQLYIGLADILLSKHVSNNVEITDSNQRNHIVDMAQSLISERRRRDTSFPSVIFGCQPDGCYGKRNMRVCSACMNNVSSQLNNDVIWVLGVGIHSVSRYYSEFGKKQLDPKISQTKAINSTIREITTFLDTQRQQFRRDLIFISAPSYHFNANFPTQHTRMADFYTQLLPEMESRSPFVDVFQMTDSCSWKNCSIDGSHRSRFVNRWKAQLLLNTLCEVV